MARAAASAHSAFSCRYDSCENAPIGSSSPSQHAANRIVKFSSPHNSELIVEASACVSITAIDPGSRRRRSSSSRNRSSMSPTTAAYVPASREDGGVKRSTAVGHLVEIGEVATDRLALRETNIGWPLEELWVAGDLLGLADTIDACAVVVVVVVVLDVPAGELPWLAVHPAGDWVGDQLRLGRRPVRWCYRPRTWPVWNHEHRRLVRFWTAPDGLGRDVIEALRSRRLDGLVVVELTADELVDQIREELVASRRHLRYVLDNYWNRDWRRAHKGDAESPDDHLWRAATAVEDMREALVELGAAD